MTSQNEMSRKEYWREREARPAREEMEARGLMEEVKAAMANGPTTSWTREETIARRERWNAAVKSGKYTKGGRISAKSVLRLQKDMGFMHHELKAAIEAHGLI